ncbi:unnamed protein product [Cyprideis torosa]|uniref:Uncharacterized protein n=1 Tax=Cyprideis torosa TaxID=163714 RepID=A0A7R8W4B1_9CRUS|nr:unnamed protein product [Cyprideis torosa]CAG0879404.1 unnamed protein product [Cyprideis torosa]
MLVKRSCSGPRTRFPSHRMVICIQARSSQSVLQRASGDPSEEGTVLFWDADLSAHYLACRRQRWAGMEVSPLSPPTRANVRGCETNRAVPKSWLEGTR